jgi:hypothetical protein
MFVCGYKHMKTSLITSRENEHDVLTRISRQDSNPQINLPAINLENVALEVEPQQSTHLVQQCLQKVFTHLDLIHIVALA